jgi:hypothetical protein
MTHKTGRILLMVGFAALFFAFGVLIEEAIDGDEVGGLAVGVAIAGGVMAAVAAHTSSNQKT